MKKRFLGVILICSMIISHIPIRVLAEEDYSGYFAGDLISVVALGGSITSKGAYKDSWGKLFCDWLDEHTAQNVKFYNAGVGGTGSEAGLNRMYEDVVPHNPDIVFVEFSVNDRMIAVEKVEDTEEADTAIEFDENTKSFNIPKDSNGYEHYVKDGKKYTYVTQTAILNNVYRSMDQLLRQLMQLEKRPVVIMNYVGIGTNYYPTHANGERLILPRPVKEIHQSIADRYSIPFVDIDSYIQSGLKNGSWEQSYIFGTTDCVHPSTEARKIYAEYIINEVRANPAKYLTKSEVMLTDVEKHSENTYENVVHTLPYTMGEYSDGSWVVSQYSDDLQTRYMMKTNKPGDSVTFKFKGSRIAPVLKGESFKVRIDMTNYSKEGDTQSIELSNNAVSRYNLNAKLEHEVTVTLLEGSVGVHGIVCDMEMGDYISEEEFNANYKAVFDGFSFEFDHEEGLKNVVDAGWTKTDDIAWDVAANSDVLTVKTKSDTTMNLLSNALFKTIPNNYNGVINFNVRMKADEGQRVLFMFKLNNEEKYKELLTVNKNGAGMMIRAADSNSSAIWFEETNSIDYTQYHTYTLQMNFKGQNMKFFIDGAEAEYYRSGGLTEGMASAYGGVTLCDTGISDLKIVSYYGGKTTYIDSISMTDGVSDIENKIYSYKDVAETTLEDKAELDKIKEEIALLENTGVSISASAKEYLELYYVHFEELAQMLKESEHNLGVIGYDCLFKLKYDADISGVTLNSKSIESDAWQKKGKMVLIDGSVLTKSGKNVLSLLQDGKTVSCVFELSEPEVVKYHNESVNLSTNFLEGQSGGYWARPKDWLTRSSGYSVYMNYNTYGANSNYDNSNGANVSYQWDLCDLSGRYNIFYYDVETDKNTTNTNQYGTTKVKIQIGEDIEFEQSLQRNGSYIDMGEYSFTGSESFVVSNTENVTGSARMFIDHIKLERIYDNSNVDKVFETGLSVIKSNGEITVENLSGEKRIVNIYAAKYEGGRLSNVLTDNVILENDSEPYTSAKCIYADGRKVFVWNENMSPYI